MTARNGGRAEAPPVLGTASAWPRVLARYSAAPYVAISARSASVSSRGVSPLTALALCTCRRIVSTTSGLASVVTSPTSAKLETDAITRRMILPDLVLGMSETIQTFLGRAILPISTSMALVTFSAIPSAETPGLSETYISTIRPLMSSITGTAAASARSEEHTSELQSRQYLACRLLLETNTLYRSERQCTHAIT